MTVFDKRLLFVSGKGGVGKTTVAAGLALAAAKARPGSRIAIVELGNDFIPERLGHPPAGHNGVELSAEVSAFNVTPRRAFEEYASRELKSHRLYSILLDNRFVHYFLDATPGINALLCLGKIRWMLEEEGWDCCIVDLPATGHGLGFLDVPRVVMQAVHLGPMRDLGGQLCRLLQDPDSTGVVLVTHLEELPVNETIEMAARLTDPLAVAWGPVVGNAFGGVPVPRGLEGECSVRRSPKLKNLFEVADFLNRQRQREEAERARLVESLRCDIVDVPFILCDSESQLIGAVANHLERLA